MTALSEKDPRKDGPARTPAAALRYPKRLGTPLLVLAITGFIIACLLLSAPASAGTKYMAGSPDLSAYISGTNEFSPGSSVTLPIIVENSGTNEYKFIQSSIVDRDDLPNTAKFLTVRLGAGDAPLIVKSDPQLVGDVRASTSASSAFSVKVLSDAPAGTYTLPVTLTYSYLYQAEQYATDSIRYYYKDVNETINIPITIKPRVKIAIVSAETDQVNAGTEGVVTLTVRNNGYEDGTKAVLKISRNENSPVTPTQSSVYIGDFAKGQTISAAFRVQTSAEAEEQVYPLNVLATYEDSEGDVVTSDTETVGIPVGRKVEFTITSDAATIVAGQKKIVTVRYRNTGGAAVDNAQARLSAVDPFTCSDDVAFLGTVAPGETKEAAFEVSVAGSATPKEYGLDSEIRFRDSLDNSRISDPLKVRINVSEKPGIMSSIAANPGIVAIIAVLIIAGIAAYALWFRKRDR